MPVSHHHFENLIKLDGPFLPDKHGPRAGEFNLYLNYNKHDSLFRHCIYLKELTCFTMLTSLPDIYGFRVGHFHLCTPGRAELGCHGEDGSDAQCDTGWHRLLADPE